MKTISRGPQTFDCDDVIKCSPIITHDHVIKWKHFLRYWAFVGNSPVTSEFPAQKLLTRSFDVFFDLRLNINGWENNHEAADLRCHRPPYDVTAMQCMSSSQLHAHLSHGAHSAWFIRLWDALFKYTFSKDPYSYISAYVCWIISKNPQHTPCKWFMGCVFYVPVTYYLHLHCCAVSQLIETGWCIYASVN